ncbi:MAG TPA: SBBP repeat-containing protein [Gemmatimonadales bacterium]|nr:SBBP repeat-containing protein [Gemmatimonadales bacterium]
MRHPRSAVVFTLSVLMLGCEGQPIDRGFPSGPNPPASPPVLAFRVGDIGAEVLADMVVDPTGGVYLTGTFAGTTDFDPGAGVAARTSLGSTDVFLAKYSAGAFVWVAQIGGTGAERVTSLARDAAGNLYLGGAFQGSTDFDPGAGGQVLTSLGGEDGFVVKLSAVGDFIWSRRFGGTGADQVTGVAVDATGRTYATGVFSGSADLLPALGPTIVSNGAAQDAFLLGLDAVGAVDFLFPIGGTDTDRANAIAVTSGGVVVVGGAFRGSAAFANSIVTQLTSQGGGDAFLAGYATDGTLVWARGLGGIAEEEIRAGGLAPDAVGGVVATGTFTGTTDFDGGTGVASRTSLGGTDWFAVRYDGAGSFQSVFAVGSVAADPAPRPAADPDGSLLVTGGFSGAVDFDPGSGSTVIASLGSAGATDAFVAKYSFAGGLTWVSRFGEGTSVAERQNRGVAVAPFPSGGVVTAGQFFGSPDFDPGAPAFRLTSLGSADVFVVLLTNTGALSLTP